MVDSRCGRPGQLELDDGQLERGWRSKTPEKIMSHSEVAGEKALVARLLASRRVRSPAPRILPWRRVAVCRLSGMSSAWAAAQNGSYSGRS